MPRKTCGAEAARAHLPELLERAHRGTPTVITRHGKPFAAVVAVSVVDTAGNRQGVSLFALKGSGAGCWGEDSGRRVAEMRDEWA